jgi:hypothetical protein
LIFAFSANECFLIALWLQLSITTIQQGFTPTFPFKIIYRAAIIPTINPAAPPIIGTCVAIALAPAELGDAATVALLVLTTVLVMVLDPEVVVTTELITDVLVLEPTLELELAMLLDPLVMVVVIALIEPVLVAEDMPEPAPPVPLEMALEITDVTTLTPEEV